MEFNVAYLIEEFGMPFVMSRATHDTYDPATGSSPSTTSTETVTAVSMAYSAYEMANTNIESSDRKIIFNAKTTGLAANPQIGDTFSRGGVTLRVKEVRKVEVGQGIVSFVCRVGI